MRRELEAVEIPGEESARARAHDVVLAAFAEHEPIRPRSHVAALAFAAVVVAALAAVVASSPGQAVFQELREAVGVTRAEPALLSLPADGRLLVSSDAGIWVVERDGSKRLLEGYEHATWSPFGRFIAATRANELAALEPDGGVRWTIAREGARTPGWTGTAADTRIAYLDRSGLRVVAGDASGDRLLLPRFRGAFALKPGLPFTIAHASPNGIIVRDIDTGRIVRKLPFPATPTHLEWSRDGKRLLALSPRSIRVFGASGKPRLDTGPGMAPLALASLAPDGKSLAFVQHGTTSSLWSVPRIRPDANAARQLFSGRGSLDALTWSPDGRWLLLSWPAANQWLFVRSDGHGVRAVGDIAGQFRSGTSPTIEGWIP